MPKPAILVLLLLVGSGCGGTVRNGDKETASGGSATTAAGAATGGAPEMTPNAATTEPLDDTSHKYPSVPDGGAGFFWRWGLGNWFVSGSIAGRHDAAFDDVDGIRVWKASGAAGERVDLW